MRKDGGKERPRKTGGLRNFPEARLRPEDSQEPEAKVNLRMR